MTLVFNFFPHKGTKSQKFLGFPGLSLSVSDLLNKRPENPKYCHLHSKSSFWFTTENEWLCETNVKTCFRLHCITSNPPVLVMCRCWIISGPLYVCMCTHACELNHLMMEGCTPLVVKQNLELKPCHLVSLVTLSSTFQPWQESGTLFLLVPNGMKSILDLKKYIYIKLFEIHLEFSSSKKKKKKKKKLTRKRNGHEGRRTDIRERTRYKRPAACQTFF